MDKNTSTRYYKKEVLSHIKERSEDSKVKQIKKLDSSIFKHLPENMIKKYVKLF